MKTRTVKKTSIFPANTHAVFCELQKLSTLQYIAAPYASFTPTAGAEGLLWDAGRTFSFHFRLFGMIPYGTHVIHVRRFDEGEIYTNEGNEHVPTWNHRITLKATDGGGTEYTDEVEIGAGWKTTAIWLWAKAFYAHRQRKWIKLLNRGGYNDVSENGE